MFSDTVACVGNPELRGCSATLQVKQPFYMVVSSSCRGYYRLAQGKYSNININMILMQLMIMIICRGVSTAGTWKVS